MVIAGAGENAAASRQSFSELRLLGWLSAGLGSAVLPEPLLLSKGLDKTQIYNLSLVLGAPILAAVLLTALDQLSFRRPLNLAVALIVFGITSLLGSFVTRNGLGDYYVVSPRYVRYSSFTLCGLAWYWLLIRRDWVDRLLESTTLRGVLSVTWLAVFLVFCTQLWGHHSRTESTAGSHTRREAVLQQFAYGDMAMPAPVHTILSVKLREQPEAARRVLRFYLECRADTAHCAILHSGQRAPTADY